MYDTNIVVLKGNLVCDPESKVVQNGTQVCNFSIAHNGRTENDVSYFDIVVFGKGADVAQKYLLKGSKVLIEGRLKQSRWTDKDGKNRSKVNIICGNLTFLDSKKANQPSDVGYGEYSGY